MTKKALEKLPEVCKAYCEFKKANIKKAILSGNQTVCTEERKKLRGYLECLSDIGTLSRLEMQTLYWYYATI